MPYVVRDSSGAIIALYEHETAIQTEWLPDDSPDINLFRQSRLLPEKALKELADSDLELIRVLEDLVELLINKQLFAFTELPLFAQQKLSKRQQMRSDMVSLSSLIDTDEGIF